jgi:hypothetical protein
MGCFLRGARRTLLTVAPLCLGVVQACGRTVADGGDSDEGTRVDSEQPDANPDSFAGPVSDAEGDVETGDGGRDAAMEANGQPSCEQGDACTPGNCAPTLATGSQNGEVSPPCGACTCETIFGWGWDGTKCIAIVGCACVGDACNALVPTHSACIEAYAHCGP